MAAGSVTESSLSGDPARVRREQLISRGLQLAAIISIIVSAAIVLSLLGRAAQFLGSLTDISQLWATEGWRPNDLKFDVRTILVGSVIISSIAILVAGPMGVAAAVYLSEYANPRTRRVVKPILEVLAGVPSVVLGFFALTVITPNLVQAMFSGATTFNMLSGGIAVGILVSPLMASVTEDALQAVPMSLREASFGLGARRMATTIRVVLPAAISGIVAAFIISMSRAIGETMIVTIAAGGSGSQGFEANPLHQSLTMTSAITNLAIGSDTPPPQFGDPLSSLYFVGLLLFFITLGLNFLGDRIVRKYRRAY